MNASRVAVSHTIVTIRQANSSDRAALETCFCELQAFEQTLVDNLAEPAAICAQYLDELEAKCAKYAGVCLVAETAGDVVGFVCVLARALSDEIEQLDREYAFVTDLVVLEPFRRLGIGSLLLDAAEAYAAGQGATRLRIGVLAANFSAHRLYHKLGYVDKEIILEKRLTPGKPATHKNRTPLDE
jgi:ribosomal protein S18 acetylase RimI-like enzyme